MKNKASYALFLAQLAGMLFYVIAQFYNMLSVSVQGISLVWLICAEFFTLVNIALSFNSRRIEREEGLSENSQSNQLIMTHVCWAVGIASLAVPLWLRRQDLTWSWYDNLTMIIVVVAFTATLLTAWYHGLGIMDGIVKGVLAAIFRGIPHLCLAYKIYLDGGKGIALVTVIVAHVTVGLRIGQTTWAAYKTGWRWNRALKGIMIGEINNEITWTVVTVMWVLWFYNQ